jgi:hypothetical protein
MAAGLLANPNCENNNSKDGLLLIIFANSLFVKLSFIIQLTYKKYQKNNSHHFNYVVSICD